VLILNIFLPNLIKLEHPEPCQEDSAPQKQECTVSVQTAMGSSDLMDPQYPLKNGGRSPSKGAEDMMFHEPSTMQPIRPDVTDAPEHE
jgi:hypothetical protein